MPSPLTSQEKRVILAAADGKGDKEIAAALRITHGTIRVYWKRIQVKLGTVNRTHSVAVYLTSEFEASRLLADEILAELDVPD